MCLTPLVMTVRPGMTVPVRPMTIVPMFLPFSVAVAPFLLFLHRLWLAIIIMTMPGFMTPFVNHMPFRIAVAAFDFHNVRVRIELFYLSVSKYTLRKRRSGCYAER